MGVIKQAVEEFVAANSKSWRHDRSKTVGASEIGQCERRTWAIKFEHTPSGVARNHDFLETWGARWRGDLIEQHLLAPALQRKYGERACYFGDEQTTLQDDYLSATPDGLIDEDEGCFLVEFKSIDPRFDMSNLPKPEHIFQVQVQMGMFRNKTDWHPSHAIISYTDASFLNEILEFQIDYDAALYVRAKYRAASIMQATGMSDLKPEGWISGGKECDYCPFSDACGRERVTPPGVSTEPVDIQFVAEIADLAKELKAVDADIASWEERKRDLQTDIKQRMREKGQKRIVGDGVSVSWSAVSGRTGYDIPGLKEACAAYGLDVETFKFEGQPGDRLTVTLKKPAQTSV